MERTEERVVEFLLSEQVEHQVFSSYLQKEGQSNQRSDDLRPDLALVFLPDASSLSLLGEPGVPLSLPSE